MASEMMTFGQFIERYPAGFIAVDELHDPDQYEHTVEVFEQVLDVEVLSEGKTYRCETESGRIMMVPEGAMVKVRVD